MARSTCNFCGMQLLTEMLKLPAKHEDGYNNTPSCNAKHMKPHFDNKQRPAEGSAPTSLQKKKSLFPKSMQTYSNFKAVHTDAMIPTCSQRYNYVKLFTKIQSSLKRFTEIPQSQNSHAMLQSGAQETVASTTKLRPAEGSAPPTLRNKHTMISKYSQTELQQLQMFQKT